MGMRVVLMAVLLPFGSDFNWHWLMVSWFCGCFLRCVMSVGVVVMMVGEALFQHFKPAQIFVALGFAVSSLSAVLVENALECKLAH